MSEKIIFTHNASFWFLPGAIPDSLTLLTLAFRAGDVRRLIRESSIAACADKDWHRREWVYRNGMFVCDICERLNPWVA